jgi:hypothetical protein
LKPLVLADDEHRSSPRERNDLNSGGLMALSNSIQHRNTAGDTTKPQDDNAKPTPPDPVTR